MAGDWIQIDCDLPEKPEVQRICDITDQPIDVVLGRLLLLWRWVDRQADGAHIAHANLKTCARVANGDEKFWEAVLSVGWIEINENGALVIPGWKKRFSKSAKARALTAKRVALLRLRKCNARVTLQRNENVTGALAKEEKRREENITPPTPSRVKTNHSAEVLAIYEAYPLKKSRGAALKAIAGALRKISPSELLEAVGAYAKARIGADGKVAAYTPNPATWFNGECWLDDRSAWVQKNGSTTAVQEKPRLMTAEEKANWRP